MITFLPILSFSVMLFSVEERACYTNSHQVAKNDTNYPYQLVWSDEFNKEGVPDTTKWRFETGFVRNEEAQWYQKKYAKFSRNHTAAERLRIEKWLQRRIKSKRIKLLIE